MPDAFDPAPDAALPTEGEFRTSFSAGRWRRHTGMHFAVQTGLLGLIPIILLVTKGWNDRMPWILLGTALLIGAIWGLVLSYRARRSRHESIVIDWSRRTVRFGGMRCTEVDLLNRGPLGVSLGFEEVLGSRRDPGYRYTPPQLSVRATETSIQTGLHFDDVDALIARLNRIGAQNPKPKLLESVKRLRLGPITLLFILLTFSAFLIAVFMLLNP